MTLFEHLESIDSVIAERERQENENSLLLAAGEAGLQAAYGKGFHSGSDLPWQPGSTIAKMSGRDFDQDGYPDFVDFYFGPGAYSPFDTECPGD